uniref:BZIP domain-containing protein n=1 Tax=Angiostrongylus cantonensis TaxID=6313 RepID=A0A0K0CZN2_ANGCA
MRLPVICIRSVSDRSKGLHLTPENGIKSGKFQDEAYYERRRRNNDAAKRSRDARRIKEEAIAARAAQLERENGQLRAQVKLSFLISNTLDKEVEAAEGSSLTTNY